MKLKEILPILNKLNKAGHGDCELFTNETEEDELFSYN